MGWYKHLQLRIPESVSQNKITVLGQYVTKLEKVMWSELIQLRVFIVDH